jgi:hypothetical protein
MELPQEPAEPLPARGEAGKLQIVPHTGEITLVDTPDLDGDRPEHHALADRAFRWADTVVFLVTPEKYQMTELLPYYRLARRYCVPALFVMNKCQEREVLEDYRQLLAQQEWEQVKLFAIPRDDAAYEPPADMNLAALKSALAALPPPKADTAGLRHRRDDLLSRLHDQVIDPLRQQRRKVDEIISALRAMETPVAGLDVSPLTRQLQQRLQDRSVLYLMGPKRMLDRARQQLSLLAKVPREVLTGVKAPRQEERAALPDFPAILSDQFVLLHARIDELLRADPDIRRWLNEDYDATKISPDESANIAREELAELKKWLEAKWNAHPRDTRMILRLVKHLPGGEKLTQWSEAAPYLLTIVLALHHALWGGMDLLVIGGYSLFVWLTEKLSDEVAARTRKTNQEIARRFEALTHEQIQRTIRWLDSKAPSNATLSRLEKAAMQAEER